MVPFIAKTLSPVCKPLPATHTVCFAPSVERKDKWRWPVPLSSSSWSCCPHIAGVAGMAARGHCAFTDQCRRLSSLSSAVAFPGS